MNKMEKLAVALLFAALMGWMFIMQPRMAQQQEAAARQAAEQRRAAALTNDVSLAMDAGVTNGVAVQNPELRNPAAPESTPGITPATAPEGVESPAVAATNAPAADEARHEAPEARLSLSNTVTCVTISSWGGGVVEAEMQRKEYRQAVDMDSPPLRFDFSERPALSLQDIPGLSAGYDFSLSQNGSTIVVERVTARNLHFVRTYYLADRYSLSVVDTFTNEGKDPVSLQRTGVALGPMKRLQSKSSGGRQYGPEVELDVLPPNSNVQQLGNDRLPKLFGVRSSMFGCGRQDASGMPATVTDRVEQAIDWGAANNKFFTQILLPETGDIRGALGCRIYAARDTNTSAFVLDTVSMDLICEGKELAPGETLTRRLNYYLGPKKYDMLKDLGNDQDKVMLYAYSGWGWFRGVCVACLWLLNKIYDLIPNYGLAIILLTIMVRLVFWPITRKSAQSMQKMKELQPQLKELQAKYKENPQKLQQETWGLYKKHKVNPMSSCLPMLVQMPFFIALFVVLRSAVELRFAPFLWVGDLSEPENLFEGMIPFIGSLNILPLFMTVVSFIQQKITPTAGDPQQQKMMAFMPFFMLFIFYSMPSALVLYWSVSQVLAILGILWQRWLKAAQARA